MNWVARIDYKIVRYLKKAALAALTINQSPGDVHNKMMEVHWEAFVRSKNKHDLQYALEHLTAYFSSHYSFRNIASVSDKIAEAAGYLSIDDYLHFNRYSIIPNNLHSLTRYAINDILGPGFASATRKGIKRDFIINEIFTKIHEHKVGIYPYIMYDCDHEKIKITFLIIQEKEIYLQDNEGNTYKLVDIPKNEIKQVSENEYRSGILDFDAPDYIEKFVISTLWNAPDLDIHKNFLNIYWRFYENLNDKIYLKFALGHLENYLNSSFDIKELDGAIIKKILTAAGYQSLNDFLRSRLTKNNVYRVHLSRKVLDNALGIGFASKAKLGITRKNIIDDIISKISKHSIGIYSYPIYDSRKEEHICSLHIEANKVYLINGSGDKYIFTY